MSLTALASVKHPEAGHLTLLNGGVALTGFEPHSDWTLRLKVKPNTSRAARP